MIFVSRILRKERPDAILPTLGGQTGLNMAIELDKSGILDELGIEILGTKLDAIHKAEDRDLFRNLMYELGAPVPESDIIHNLDEAKRFVAKLAILSLFDLPLHLAVQGRYLLQRSRLRRNCDIGFKIFTCNAMSIREINRRL